MAEGNTPKRFVPSGVDADTWIGFEARIQERRFKALVETITTAIAARDGVAARVALEELRELRPAAPELPDLAARVALLPVGEPVAEPASYLWSRGLGAVATFVVGVGLVMGLESVRSGTPAPAPAPPAIVTQTAVASTPETSAPLSDPLADAAAAPITDATVTDAAPPAPTPVATTSEPRREEPVGTPSRATFREARALDTRLDEVVPAGGEVPDQYVAPGPRSENRSGYTEAVTAPGPQIAANVVRQPVSITQPPPVLAASVAAPAASITTPTLRNENTRVAQVLNQYARAYGDLDPAAARAVWPSVDERALSRAFASLESQDVSFDSCNIDVKGSVASASCRGSASYVGKVGNRQARTEARQWDFELQLEGDDWKIAKADVK